MAFNWRPIFDAEIVKRELEIIKTDLHCNAVRIGSQSVERLMIATKLALEQGLEVWPSPANWDRTPEETLAYITSSAAKLEKLRAQWPDRLVLSVGSELTLFMRGIVEGNNFSTRLKNPSLIPRIKSGEHDKPLNDFLERVTKSVREVFHGKITYASLVWEAVNWDLFDFVGVDHYRAKRIEDRYVEMLKPAFSHGKPVVITEFGYSTTQGGPFEQGFLSSAGLGGGNIIDFWSQFFHYKLPFFGRFVKLHLNGSHIRDEKWQAAKLVEQLAILDSLGVDGAFVSQFESQITPFSENPKFDLDMASSSLVKYFEGGRQGSTYPDMPWEPKESFRAVSEYYGKH
jgi:hypothetical protein